MVFLLVPSSCFNLEAFICRHYLPFGKHVVVGDGIQDLSLLLSTRRDL